MGAQSMHGREFRAHVVDGKITLDGNEELPEGASLYIYVGLTSEAHARLQSHERRGGTSMGVPVDDIRRELLKKGSDDGVYQPHPSDFARKLAAEYDSARKAKGIAHGERLKIDPEYDLVAEYHRHAGGVEE